MLVIIWIQTHSTTHSHHSPVSPDLQDTRDTAKLRRGLLSRSEHGGACLLAMVGGGTVLPHKPVDLNLARSLLLELATLDSDCDVAVRACHIR